MALTSDEKRAIIAYRIDKSHKTIIEAHDNAQMGHWSLAANRLYYALFHMASALLVDKGFTSKTHSGILCILGQEFVAKGMLSSEDGRLVSRLQNMRQSGDYDDLFDWAEEDILPLFEPTERLLKKMAELITLK
ncbi:MAG: HEPN domain-containing protein [Bacteroidaceae bacterium]|nr:HEPN domain-containing protein [Bacteroidaceae bacterium]